MSKLKNWVLSLIDDNAKTDIEIQLFVEKSSDECKTIFCYFQTLFNTLICYHCFILSAHEV